MSTQPADTEPVRSDGPRVAGTARRSLLATPLLLLTPARAQGVDDSLAGVMRRGALRASIGFWMAGFVTSPRIDDAPEGEAPLRDGFHEALARMIAQELGVRAEILPALRSGDGLRRLNSGEVDVALAPPVTRALIREVMFCSPHLTMDLVLVGRPPPAGERARPNLQAMRLGCLTILAPALLERGTVPAVTAVPDPWRLARLLLAGELDGIVITSAMSHSLLRHVPETELRMLRALTSSPFAPALAYGAHDLRRVVNLLMDQALVDGRLAALFRRETGLPYVSPYPS